MLSLERIVAATGGAPGGIDDMALVPMGISTDSRSIVQGELFVALAGPNFDGHDYCAEAFEKGAVTAVVSRDMEGRTIKVDDTLIALGDIAKACRDDLDIPVVMITGTNGKTTVKNLLRDLLSLKYEVYANPGNFNNLIGLPLSVMEITAEHEIAVLEAGINQPGEMARLAQIARPTHGIFTNIGPGHLEGLGSLADILDAKWELADAVKARDGRMYLNADYPQIVKRARDEALRFETFALQEGAKFKPQNVLYTTEGTSFTLMGQEFSLPLLGPGNLANATAALSVAVGEFDIPLAQAAEVIAEAKPEKWRLEHRMAGDVHLLVDCYNANPVSVRESLDLLTLFPEPRMAVLGAMLELGDESERYHHEILELARDTADLVIITGPHNELYPPHEGVLVIPDKSKAAEELHKRLVPGATVLVKGSRACALEDVVSELWSKL